MLASTRRSFLASSFAAAVAGGQLLGQDEPPAKAEKLDLSVPPRPPEEVTFEPSTLHLTWFRDPTTTMVIQWIGTVGETLDTKIYYAPAVSGTAGVLGGGAAGHLITPWKVQPTAAKPYPMTDFKVFRAELTGLAPDTDYQFRIGRSSGTYKFRTAPAKATNGIPFITGGDCGVNAHAIANNVQAARQDPLFAVVGGDLGYDNGKSVETSLAFIRNFGKHMVARGGRMIPIVTCIGNHEVDGGYKKTREKAPFYYALFDGLFTDTGYATLDFGDYLSLVLLDTDHTSPIGGEQAAWLEKQLKDRVDRAHTMVVNHVPCYPSFRNPVASGPGVGTGELNRKHWVPLFDKYRVPVVLEHHDHTFKRTKPLLDGLAHTDGVLYLGDGSWGKLRVPQKADKLGVMATTSGDYHLTLHRLQGEERFHMALDENGRVMDVSRSGQRKLGLVRAGS